MKPFTTADRLIQLMEDRHLRQVDILNSCTPYCQEYDVKMNKSDISQYLARKSEPNQDKLFVLGKALNVSEAWLMGYDVPMERTAKQIILPPSKPSRQGVKIPVLGRVAAGIPMEAIEDVIDEEEISEEMARGGEFFGLVIRGDSMAPKMDDGDIIIVRKQDDAESGEVVVAMVNDDDAACKRLMKYKEGIALLSTNPNYEPLYFSKKEIQDRPVRILGKVVELRAKF